MVWIQLPLKTLAMQVIPATGGFFRLILMLSYIARATKQPLYTSSHKSRHSAPDENCAPPVIMRIWIIYLCLFYSRSLDPAPFFCFYGTSRHGNMPVHQPQMSSLHSFFKIVTFLHGISFWKGSNAWSMKSASNTEDGFSLFSNVAASWTIRNDTAEAGCQLLSDFLFAGSPPQVIAFKILNQGLIWSQGLASCNPGICFQ